MTCPKRARLTARILRLIESAYLRWAIREISPAHPDFPRIFCRLNELEQS